MKHRMVIAVGAIMAVSISAGAYFGPDQYRIYKAKEAVRQMLRDPESAVFPQVKAGENAVCGMVNSRNGYGAMAGPSAFLAKDDKPVELEPKDLFHSEEELERAQEYWRSMADISYEAGRRAGDEYKKVLEDQRDYLRWWAAAEEACLTREEKIELAASASGQPAGDAPKAGALP